MLEIKNLTVKFNNKLIINNLNASIKDNEKIVVLGQSGSGKTTLLNTLLGFVPNFEGQIFYDNLQLTPNNLKKIRQQTAWLPQQVDVYFTTVKELFFSLFELKNNRSNKPSENQLIDIFQKLNLNPDLLEKNINQISGGQKQRIALASIYLLNKPYIFLDEPTSALDDENKLRVIDLFVNHCKSTVIIATHDHVWLDYVDKHINLDKQ